MPFLLLPLMCRSATYRASAALRRGTERFYLACVLVEDGQDDVARSGVDAEDDLVDPQFLEVLDLAGVRQGAEGDDLDVRRFAARFLQRVVQLRELLAY